MMQAPDGPVPMAALQNIRVVDVTRFISGPYCAMYLGDLGADVIKIEHPRDGDGTRRWGSGPHPADNPYYLSVNRNKRSVGLDLKQPGGLRVLEELIACSDVLLTNAIPGTLEALGITPARLAGLNPRLVQCEITGYGPRGPDRERGAFDFTIQAEAGMMALNGDPDGPPMKVGAPIMDVLTGLNACIAVLAALVRRASGGPGGHVGTSMIETALASMPNIVSDYLVGAIPPLRHGNAHPNLVPYEIYQTRDRWIALGLGNEPQWARFCALIGQAGLQHDPRFASNVQRIAHRAALNRVLQPVFAEHPLAWWLEALTAAAIPCAPVNTVDEALGSPQAQALGVVQQVPHPLYGEIRMARSPLAVDGVPLPIHRAPPTLGQHTTEVLSQLLGRSADEIAALRATGAVAGA